MLRLSIVLFITIAVAQVLAANDADKPVAKWPVMHPEMRAREGPNALKQFPPVIINVHNKLKCLPLAVVSSLA
jgi:hypothetical protein